DGDGGLHDPRSQGRLTIDGRGPRRARDPRRRRLLREDVPARLALRAARGAAQRAIADRAWMRLRAPALVGRDLAHLAAVVATVLLRDRLLLRGRREDLGPLPVLEHDLVAALEDLERLLDLPAVVELRRVGLSEDLEVRRVDEVRHQEAVHLEP